METTLRNLKKEDASFMLEWMHDDRITDFFEKPFSDYMLADVEKFCLSEQNRTLRKKGDNLHLAIVNDKDEYLGTISLKNYDPMAGKAEYAIVVRKCAQGTGVAQNATKEILEKAFSEYNLNRVYLTVLNSNSRAMHFYEKCGFKKEGELRNHVSIKNTLKNLLYYGLLKEEYSFEYLD